MSRSKRSSITRPYGLGLCLPLLLIFTTCVCFCDASRAGVRTTADGAAQRRRVWRPRMTPWRAAASPPWPAAPPNPPAVWRHASGEPHPTAQCEERWRDARLDHFARARGGGDGATFRQRYFVCARHYDPDRREPAVFFYAGNEANVELYLNHTGLMFESAADFGALLVFAEHRYYGKSRPFGDAYREHLGWLTAEQAMADYAELVGEVKAEFGAERAAVVAFGGSYGGMLAAWLRMKYPHVFDGAVAASAPIWNFLGEDPPFDAGSFAAGVTYDATPAAGSAASCAPRVRASWAALARLGADEGGRRRLREVLGLCGSVELKDADDVEAVRDWLAEAWDYMAMGNYPYESGYMLNGDGALPAYPVRAACREMDAADDSTPEGLLRGLSAAAAVFYNYSGALECLGGGGGPNPESDDDAGLWDYQWCTELLMPSARDGVRDMFWPDPFDLDAARAACNATWGATPDPLHAQTEWGGRRIGAATNIVFSNGRLDPWAGGGVLKRVSGGIAAVVIPEGAHHLDLMWSNDLDPASVIHARRLEMGLARRWVQEAARRPAEEEVAVAAS